MLQMVSGAFRVPPVAKMTDLKIAITGGNDYRQDLVKFACHWNGPVIQSAPAADLQLVLIVRYA